MRRLVSCMFLLLFCSAPAFVLFASAADYRVGPGQQFAEIDAAPLSTLTGGDRLFIHWRPAPYLTKFTTGCGGTAGNPLLISGVPDPSDSSRLPILEGASAVNANGQNFPGGSRSVIKIGSSNTPSTTACGNVPQYIVIENLQIQGANSTNVFEDRGGATGTSYSTNAAAITVEFGRFLTFRGLRILNNGNGIFVGNGGGQTSDITIEHCEIFSNGVPSSFLEHNTYTEANGIVYQYNYFGPLCGTCTGNNLKDRSIGTVIRYNYIVDGNRHVDLVETGLSSWGADVKNDNTYVYGNVFEDKSGINNRQMIHFGYDGNSANGRGTLWAYYNTLISRRVGRTSLVRMGSSAQTAHFVNNIIYASDPQMELSADPASGTITFDGNWVTRPYELTFSANPSPPISITNEVAGSTTLPVDPNTYRPLTSLPGTVTLPAALSAHPVANEFGGGARTSLTDLGAVAFGSSSASATTSSGSTTSAAVTTTTTSSAVTATATATATQVASTATQGVSGATSFKGADIFFLVGCACIFALAS